MPYNKPFFLTVIVLFIIADASAQFTVSIRENQFTKEISTFWNINIAYIGIKENEELQLKLSLLNDNDKTIYEVLSPYLMLSNKEVRQLNTGFGTAQTITNEMTSSSLPDGKYEVVYRENKSNKLLRRKQFTVNGETVTFTSEADLGRFDVKKWVTTTGSARITTAFNSPQGFNSEQKNFYSRLEFNPTVVLMGQIPIGLSVLLSTEQTPNLQPINQMSLNFDCNYFRTLLEQKAMAKIEELKAGEGLGELDELKEKFKREKNKGFEELKAKLASPEMAEQLAKAEEYNSLEEQAGNLEKAIDKGKLNELKTKYGVTTMEQLDAKKDQMPEKDFNEYKFQMATSDAYADAQKQLKNLEGAKKSAKKLEAAKAKLDKIENKDFMQMMRDPKYNKEILNKLGLNTSVTKLLGGLKNFNVGMSYPLYSELTMNGVRSTGFNIEINPGIAYAAFTTGTIQNQRYDTLSNKYQFQQKVMAGRLGIGKKNASHFILSYINTKEQGNAFISPIDTMAFNPGNNLIVGADWQVSLFKKKFILQGEINNSYTNSDVFAPGVPNTDQGPNPLIDLASKINFKPNLTTRMDYAYAAKTNISLFDDNTVLSGYYSYVGPGYTTYTVPFLLNDLLKYEGKLSQSFWKKQISFGGFYKYLTDNLFNSKNFTTTVSGYGAEASISLPKLPSVWAKYLPVNQVSDFTVSGQVGKLASNMTMAGSSYNFNFSKLSCNTQLLFTRYDIRDEFLGTKIQMSTYMLIQTIAFANDMNWNVNGFYNTSKDAQAQAQDQIGCSLSETSIILKKVIVGGEFHYLHQGTATSKTGGMLNVGVKILKNINAQLKLTYNNIKSPDLGDRSETYGTLVVNVVW